MNPVEARTETCSVEAFPNGRARYTVVVRDASRIEPLLIDTYNLAQADEREHLLERLAFALIDLNELERLLGQVALEVARQTVEQQERPQAGGAIALAKPEPWPTAVEGHTLLDEIARSLTRFISLPECCDTAIALWVVFAHAHDAFGVSPILAITSPEKRCGKTTCLSVVGALVPSPLLASNITAASLFRTVERYGPTLLVDEADTFLGQSEELRGILNSGHSRSAGYVVRLVGDEYEPRLFSTWCPKAIAKIGALADTLADRAINVTLRRRAPEEVVERVRLDRVNSDLDPLRRKVARWVADHLEVLRNADPEVPAVLHDRAVDNWRPLLAIADQVGGAWPERSREAALRLADYSSESDGTPGELLLGDLRGFFQEQGAERAPTKNILKDLHQRADRPWSEWKQGHPLTAKQLASILRRFGVRSSKLHFGLQTCWGYEREDFADAFRRYLAPETEHAEQCCCSSASTLPKPGTPGGTVPEPNPAIPPCSKAVPDVPGPAPGEPTLIQRGDAWEPSLIQA